MGKKHLRELVAIAFALIWSGCDGPVSGYFAPMPQSASSISSAPSGSGSSNSPSPGGSNGSSNPGGTSSGGNPSQCTPQMAQNLRILFVVDASGSTQTDDRGAKVRTSAVLNFINNNLSNSNLAYSFTYFAVDNSSYDFSSGRFSNSVNQPFGGANQAISAVNLFQNIYLSVPSNGTDYQEALSAVGALVSADNSANPGKYGYAVIFMSDGEPNRGPDTSSTIDPLVTNLINIVGASRMTLSSVYFSNAPDTNDEGIIDNMAIAGNGQYVNGNSANLNLAMMIQGILSVPSSSCPMVPH